MSDVSSPISLPPNQAAQLLFVGRSLDFQSTADQALAKKFGGTSFVITQIIAIRRTGAASIACTGGIYDAPSKGGNVLVAGAQSWVTLALGVNINAVLAAAGATMTLSAAALYLSLTVGSTAAVTGDVFVFGLIVD